MPLPARLTSLYRLTLRALSASVLHQRPATRNLRALYRPVFEEAARVAKSLEQSKVPDRASEEWFLEWEERMNNTLTLFLSSARYRGLAHRVTRNLSLLSLRPHNIVPAPPRWNTDPGKEHVLVQGINRLQKRRVDMATQVDRAMGELREMAEGSAGVVLGRVVRGRPLHFPEED